MCISYWDTMRESAFEESCIMVNLDLAIKSQSKSFNIDTWTCRVQVCLSA